MVFLPPYISLFSIHYKYYSNFSIKSTTYSFKGNKHLKICLLPCSFYYSTPFQKSFICFFIRSHLKYTDIDTDYNFSQSVLNEAHSYIKHIRYKPNNLPCPYRIFCNMLGVYGGLGISRLSGS